MMKTVYIVKYNMILYKRTLGEGGEAKHFSLKICVVKYRTDYVKAPSLGKKCDDSP